MKSIAFIGWGIFGKQKQAKSVKMEEELFALDHEFHRLISAGAGKLRIWEVVQNEHALNRALKLSIHSNKYFTY